MVWWWGGLRGVGERVINGCSAGLVDVVARDGFVLCTLVFLIFFFFFFFVFRNLFFLCSICMSIYFTHSMILKV